MENKDSFSYTKYAKAAIAEGFKDELNSFYCREDFVDILERLDNAKPDNRIFWSHEFVQMCKARNLNPISLNEDRDMLEQIPAREDLLDELIKMLYKNYEHWYSPEDFMTRIVRRLAPEYAEDPVRVAILKKFILGAGFQWEKRREYSTQNVLQWAMNQFSPEEREDYEDKGDLQDRLEMMVEKLDDSIFSEEHLKPYTLTDEESFLLNVRSLYNWIAGNNRKEITTDKKAEKNLKKGQLTIDEIHLEFMEDISLKPETSHAIRDFCDQNDLEYDDSGKNIEVLKIISDAMEGNWLSESSKGSLIKSIFPMLETEINDFRKETYYKTKDGKLKLLSDSYKDDYLKVAERKKKNKLKKENNTSGDWKILRLCDTYARGIFRNYGDSQKTRILLYYFAIMFDMTVRNSDTDVPDPKTDVDKNLFRDYYNDNVLRFLEEETTKEAQNRESEPLGEGINYKSYVETIYLYFLYNKKLGANPGERIDMAEKLIDDCVKEADAEKRHEEFEEKRDEIVGEDFTKYYQEAYFYEALKKDRVDLLSYIIDHYRIDPSEMYIIKTASEQVGAFENIKWAKEAPYFGNRAPNYFVIMKQYIPKSSKYNSRWITSNNNRLWIIPSLLQEKSGYSEDKKFMRIINKLNDRLACPENNNQYKKHRKVTRNTYLSMFLSSYIQNVKTKGIDVQGKKFPEIYDDFQKEANIFLEEGRFQLFNSTNLVDLYVFLTYYAILVRNIDVYDFEYDLEKTYEKEHIRDKIEKKPEPQERKEEILPEEPER